MIENFYVSIVENMRKWIPSAPKISSPAEQILETNEANNNNVININTSINHQDNSELEAIRDDKIQEKFVG